jgi:hypothetical protein
MLRVISFAVPPDPPARVALLIDYPVLLRGVRASDPDAAPRLDDILRRASSAGGVHFARAYGAWYDIEEATAAFRAGIDPVFVPPAGPGSGPTAASVVADGLSLLRAEQIEALALSGDERLLPLVSAARASDVPVLLVAHACAPDGPCLKLATNAGPAIGFARSLTRAERYRRAPAAS